MKVLFLSRSATGTPHAFVAEQAAALERSTDVQVVHVTIRKGGFTGYAKTLFRLIRTIRTNRIDIVHAHYGLSGLLGVIAAPLSFRKVPVVITYHGSDIFKKNERLLSLLAARVAGFNILVSEKMKRWFSKRFDVIPCGIDINIPVANRVAYRRRKGWDKDDFVILFASSFNRPVKDPAFAQDVIHALRDQLSCKIHFVELSNFSRSELTVLMQSADAMLMCSHSEGSPQVIKESILNCLPVVSNEVGDVRVICRGSDHCYIVEKTVPAYINAFKTLATTRQRITENSSLILHYDNNQIVQRIYKIYQDQLPALKTGTVGNRPVLQILPTHARNITIKEKESIN